MCARMRVASTKLSIHLDTMFGVQRLCFTFFFFSLRRAFYVSCRSCALFTRLTNLFFSAKLSLKIVLRTLFTHLKIILLQYFQFSTFNFQCYPNRSLSVQYCPTLLLHYHYAYAINSLHRTCVLNYKLNRCLSQSPV